ncbi:RNA polymerase sigma-70 factor [Chitinophaga sancti]|uniref:RNA polymerase sigma factor n=1 Tax=Chitinophaga sancti TaxID=1004 RepID=UPI002A75B2F0|nr:RNA polymerase sigma-70 factor [Chitinophaga sancti]WPQ61906.1 RNA polymerase sigma-70 factor [Chitinophaga sancti]
MFNDSLLTEKELVERLRLGNHQAFKETYKRYWPLVFNHARRMLEDRELAKDVVQDVFCWLFEKMETLREDTRLPHLLMRATRNDVISLIRKGKSRNSYLSSLKVEDFYSNVTEHTLDGKELQVLIEREIASLPPKMRAVFQMSRYEDLSHKTIAETLDIAEGTVKKQVSNALSILRERLTTISWLLISLASTIFW